MALTPGRRTVNRANGRPSFISIKSDVDLFNDDTTISVVDQDGNTWSANPKYQNDAKTLPIKLRGIQSGGAVHAAPVALAAASTVDDTGQLTVTITSSPEPQPKVDVPVLYVDDPTP